MEPKKSKKADVSRQRFLFFTIGLAISLTLMIMAFSYRVYNDSSVKELAVQVAAPDDLMEPPSTEQPPPPPPVIEQPQIVEVPNEKKIEEDIRINMDVETDLAERVDAVAPVEPTEVEKEDPEQIFTIVEEIASPVGGLAAFYEFVRVRLRYPAQARRMAIEGKVYVEFVVEKDGSITDVKVVKGIGGGCDEEAIRVVQSCPKWNPAKQRGKPVRQRMVLPITFKLANT